MRSYTSSQLSCLLSIDMPVKGYTQTKNYTAEDVDVSL